MTIWLLLLFFISQALFAELPNIDSWAYQLQNANIDSIFVNNTFDLIVMDYSKDGTDPQKYTKKEIDKIKKSGKTVICYISIGEAENYRYYWKEEWNIKKPSWLGPENPNWKGNFKVKFWENNWQNIVFNYIDTIISQGFDGIYMDIIDAYYFWKEEVNNNLKNSGADTLMIEFISRIKEYISGKTDNKFYIIPQNGCAIIDESNVTSYWKERYFSCIDAIGIEDLFFYGNKDKNNPFNPDQYRISLLLQYTQKNITVLSIEYLTNDSLIEIYKKESKKYGFIPYCNTRDLDKLANGFKTTYINKSHKIKLSNLSIIKNENNIFIKTNIPISKVSLFNLLGQNILTPPIFYSQNQLRFNTSYLPKNIYYINIKFSNNIHTTSKLFIGK